MELARSLRVRTSGSREQLAARLADRLDVHAERKEPTRRTGTPQLTEPLGPETVIPPGQRCNQLLGAFFLSAIGPSFRFDAAMREFVLTANGAATLGDAVEHWHLSRQQDRKLGRQFELHRFTGQWHVDHLTGTAEQLRAAWFLHRSQPVDARPHS